MKKLIFMTTLLLSFTQVRSQVTVDAELKDLISKAIEYFPKLKEAELAHEAGEQRLDIARSAYFPTVSLNASYLYVDPVSEASFPVGPNEFKSLKFQPNNNYNATIGFNYPVIDFGRALYFVRKSNEELQQSRLSIELNKAQLAAQVANIYYSIIYLKQAVSIEDTILNYLGNNKNVIESRLENGDALQLDILNIQSTISQEENRKVDLQNLLQKQTNLLLYTTNQSAMNASGNFSFPQVAANADDALQMMTGNTEYKIAESKIKAQQLDIKLNRSNQYPIISLNGAAGYRNGYQPDIEEMVFGGQAGLTLSAPIFTGNKSRNSVKLSQIQLKQNEQGLESVKNVYKRDINQTFADIDASNARLLNMETQISQAASANKIASSRYINGVGTHVDVLNTISNLQKAELAKINYQYQLCLSRVELARLAGVVYY